MTENNLSQLVGALGGWLKARPYGAEQDALDRAARVVLDMRLLGLHIDDVDAPELDELDREDRDVVEQARVWAQARREEARRRRVVDERNARIRRVAEREAGPSDPFAVPSLPAASAAPLAEPQPVPDAFDEPETDLTPVVGDIDGPFQASGQEVGESVAPFDLRSSEPVPAPIEESGTALADPDEHEFFEADVAAMSTRAQAVGPFRPEAVFKVVIVVWLIAAIGVLAVLVGIALG